MADVAARDGGQGLWIAECLIGKQRAWGLALSVMEEWETAGLNVRRSVLPRLTCKRFIRFWAASRHLSSSRYHFSVPQHSQKITPRQNTNILMQPSCAFVTHNKCACRTILLDKGLERTKVCFIDPARSFYFDSRFAMT